jgi:release factor glutamine methyltransferase
LPNTFAVGTDVSFGALCAARDNACRLGLGRISFTLCNMADALRGPLDLIVSNPPYIPSADIAALAPEVREFDPRLALDGGRDGLDAYRAIAATASALLAPGGILIVEIGIGQAQSVAALLAAAGLVSLPPYADLNSIPRALAAEKRA